MHPLQAFLLGLLQGATEFIPISSSAHLVLVPWLLGWQEPGLAFDVVVHWGTLAAVVLYFRRDLALLAWSWLRGWRTRSWPDLHGRLVWLILLGTLPAIALGLFLEEWFEALFSAPVMVASLLVVTGLLLTVGEWGGRRGSKLEQLTWRDALFVGLGQAAAIAPGVSRSGATIAVGLLRGLRREVAARFSFLLAVPVILGAGVLQLAKLVASGKVGGAWPTLALGFVAAAASGYLCIRLLLGYLRRRSLYVFAVYCCLVGLTVILLSLINQPPMLQSEAPPTPSELVLFGPEALHPLMWDLGQAYESQCPYIAVVVTGDSTLLSDLTFTYREGEGDYQVPIALDALAILVHPRNPVRAVTLLQVQDIFAGRIHTWELLGGGQEEIRVFDQVDGVSSQHFFMERVMKSLDVTPNALFVPHDAAAVAEVALDPSAVGYASVGYLTSHVVPLALEEVPPTPENLARGIYHLIRPVYLVMPEQPAEKVARFVEFVLSEMGQAVVARRYGRVEIVQVRGGGASLKAR